MFQAGWAEVGAECEALLREEEFNNDKQEGIHHIWMMLELQAQFDIVGMHGNILIREGDAGVPDLDDRVDRDCAKNAIQLSSSSKKDI